MSLLIKYIFGFNEQMGDSVVSRPTLDVSVSFGRFENDALSWEKWSSFSPNKYLEEVEKCSTPGSVAQKKAYFEAHYKKIAAKKLEQLEEETQQVEKKMEPLSPEVAGPKAGDETENGTSDGDLSSSNGGERFSLGEQQMSVVDLKNSDAVDEPKEDVTVDVECDNLLVTKTKEPTISGIDESKDDSTDIECVSSLSTEAKEETILGTDESKEDISVGVECDNLLATKLKEETILGTCDQGELHKVEEQNLVKGCQDSVVETPQADIEAQKASLKKSKTTNANVKNVNRKVIRWNFSDYWYFKYLIDQSSCFHVLLLLSFLLSLSCYLGKYFLFMFRYTLQRLGYPPEQSRN